MTAPEARARLQAALDLLDGLRPLIGTRDQDFWDFVWAKALEDAKAAGAQYLAALK
jgi:hypothetical protein